MQVVASSWLKCMKSTSKRQPLPHLMACINSQDYLSNYETPLLPSSALRIQYCRHSSGKYALVYLDNIDIFSKRPEEHTNHTGMRYRYPMMPTKPLRFTNVPPSPTELFFQTIPYGEFKSPSIVTGLWHFFWIVQHFQKIYSQLRHNCATFTQAS